MLGDRAKRVETLSYAALERDPTQQAACLAEACAGDQSLREEVESLLRSHEEVSDFLQRPILAGLGKATGGDNPDTTEGEPDPGLPWEWLGEFRLIRRLGEGDMGVVYLAEQELLGRQVALKVIRAEGAGCAFH